jgi:hypothetical protein
MPMTGLLASMEMERLNMICFFSTLMLLKREHTKI